MPRCVYYFAHLFCLQTSEVSRSSYHNNYANDYDDDEEEQDEEEQNAGSTLIGGSSLQTVKNKLDSVSQFLLSKRPLLHIIVLFAGDPRVRKYAEEVQELFLDNGIHVFTQTETVQHQYIKPENLLEIITASMASYLIVIGDRNMKNKTCQSKKHGKLVETTVWPN